jgi:RNA polymerase sigma-70 factor (ECF subfamily)
MADSEVLAADFEQHRDHLRAVAYRLLGSMTDAEDAVQDTWLRLTGADPSEVENLGGWLTTVVARVSLNMLRSRRYRQEYPAGDSLASAADPEDEVVLADSVGLAMLVLLDALSPAERIAFVLHDMFAMPFTDVAAVLGRSAEATRQLASRARRRVHAAPSPDRVGDIARQREVASAFLAASRGGDFSALVALLDSDVVLTADAFASPRGRPTALSGATTVARGAVASAIRAEHSELALVDGSVAVVYAPAGHLRIVLALGVSADGKITAIDVIGDPERLADLRVALLPAD